MSNFSFCSDGARFTLVNDNSEVVKNFPVGIYNMCQDDKAGIYLERIDDKFTFAFEQFDFYDEFIDYVVRRHAKIHRNMGILLYGPRGNGKTSTAKVIANELNIPVVIVGKKIEDIDLFIHKIDVPCCFLFDDYEKIGLNSWHEYETLMHVIDGVRSVAVKHVFIFTMEHINLDKICFLCPDRVLYFKSCYPFSSEMIIEKFVEKYLVRKEYKEDIIKEYGRMSRKTIESMKALIDEVNDMDIAPSIAMKYLNVEVEKYEYKCYIEDVPDDVCLSDIVTDFQKKKSAQDMWAGVVLYSEKSPHEFNVGDIVNHMSLVDICYPYLLFEECVNKSRVLYVVDKYYHVSCFHSYGSDDVHVTER